MQSNALVLEEFVSADEQSHLRTIAEDYRRSGILQGNPSGPGRFRAKVYGTCYCDEQMQKVGRRIVARLGLEGCAVDPYLGWIISYIEPGARIKPHIDRHLHYQQSGDKHLRCNVLIQGDHPSACPIIGSQRHCVKERGLWAFFASDHAHGTDVLRAPLPRIVYQFGFVVRGDFALR